MRAALAAFALAAAICVSGPSGAATSPTNATLFGKAATPANATIVAQRCRCVERRWNGSCKLRVCRDRW
jgi:hypothetical protein